MCGIFAVIKKNEAAQLDLAKFTAAFSSIAHRGPDYTGIYAHDCAISGHHRLSIIDTSLSAHQPFFNADKSQWIIYNGEIFNFKSIRQTLVEKYGIVFKTESDTEVLMHYLDRGEDLNMLNGFWSFCYFNLTTNLVILSRDRYGVKPLYFYEQDDYYAISSESYPIAQYFDLKAIDKQALNGYLQFTYLTQNQSIYTGLRQMKPAVVAQIDLVSGAYSEKPYYHLANQKMLVSDASEIKKNIQEKLSAAVEKRLIADVPLGSFLSGGVDSSLVSVLAKQQKQDLECFTVKFSDHSFFDESNYAKRIAEKFNIKQTLVTFSEQELLHSVSDYLEQVDEPFADSSAIAMHLLCKKVSASIKVALTGDGADELFGGYRKHKAYGFSTQNKWIRNFDFLSGALQSIGTGRQSYWANRSRQIHKLIQLTKKNPAAQYLYLAANGGLSANSCLKPDYFVDNQSEWNKIATTLTADNNSFLALDFLFPLLGDMLVKTDRMSMLHGLELRNPFLDVDLVDYVFSIPASYKFDAQRTKHILKSSFEQLLPTAIIKRPKQGFEVPLQAWLNGPLQAEVVNKWCNKDFIVNQNIFQWEKIEAMINAAASKNAGDSVYNLWSVIVFNAWYYRRIMN